ncbi:hypothetical protein ZIOFF_056734 [Zingiber officinale]|uniref:Polyprotein n=1 Tax=Zingiber officinale TaxID=94328 RepID=A0A8J5FYD9_ZINOF|nr:hypothetical protein ZIOFF_056734 [Zingiber officinale]
MFLKKRKTARKRRRIYRHKEHRKEEVVADFKILILVVKVEEEEVTLARDSRIKIQILIVAYAEEMVMTLKVVGIDAKGAEMQITQKKTVGFKMRMRQRRQTSLKKMKPIRFMHEPSKLHYAAAKRILRYLQGTRKLGIKYVKEKENKLVGYTDSDWAGSLDDRKSTSGYIFCLGSKIISWVSKKQKTVSLSSAEAEYIAVTDAACEAVWLRRILSDVEQKQEAPTTIFCDNNSTIAMTKNPVFHARTKHIELRHHFIRDFVSDKKIQLKFINTNEQLADGFTKAVSSGKIEQLRNHVRIT